MGHFNTSVAGFLESATLNHPSANFLVDRERSLTYSEAWGEALALAAYLRSQGVRRGDRVVIHVQNRAEIPLAIFATAMVGGVFVVLNAKLREKGIAKIIQQAEPRAVVADTVTAANVPAAGIDVKILVGKSRDQWASWQDIVSASPTEPMRWEGIDVDPACLVFTSGSTGQPRGVTLSHHNIRFVVSAIQERLNYRADDVIGSFLPLAFDYGLYQIFLAAKSGATLYIGDQDQVGPRLPSVLKEAKISVLPAVPAVYAALITLHRRRPFELPELRAITNTGERLPLAYIERLRGMFPDLAVFVMYGLTECKRVSIMLPEEFEFKPDAVGRALDGTEVYAADEHGNRLPPGEAGELVVRGRHVALGYWRAPEETAKRFQKRAPERDVELFTGDRGWVDPDGFIYFAARADDLLKHRGNRISPIEIENEACGLAGIAEAAVLKREADDTLHLWVTLADPDLTESAILQSLDQVLEPAKVPEFVRIEASLPKSINGKIDRKTLQQRLDGSSS